MRLKQDWFAVPHGEIYPKNFPAGTILTGPDLARATALGLMEADACEPSEGAEARPASRKPGKGKA